MLGDHQHKMRGGGHRESGRHGAHSEFESNGARCNDIHCAATDEILRYEHLLPLSFTPTTRTPIYISIWGNRYGILTFARIPDAGLKEVLLNSYCCEDPE